MNKIYKAFPGGKHKVLTFSYDDGKLEDRRLVEIFNKNGLRGTFNLNTGIDQPDIRIPKDEWKDLYAGHEVAVHTCTHPTIARCPDNEIVYEILNNRMELEKTIVYFKASLKTNERVIKKLTSATSNIKKYLEDEDLLEDTLIETQQAIEMADIYGNILHSMTDTFASIISNNQNNIMKALALVTIVMSIPTMIFSAYGMNFKNNDLPLNGEPHAFWIIIFIAFAISVSLTVYLIHKKLF